MMRSLKSKTIYEQNAGIEKGKNWFNKSRLTKFDPLAWWHLLKAPMVASDYINKAVGVKRTLNPHKDSIRLGWRRDDDLNIKWYVYSYIKGEHSCDELVIFSGQEELMVSFKTMPDGNESTLAMVIFVPENPLLVQTITIPFVPKWFTNFYWGGDPFPNKADYFWYKSNVSGMSPLANFAKTVYSYSPLLTGLGVVTAIFLLFVLLAQVSVPIAVTGIILVLVSFLGFVLRNFINYEQLIWQIEHFMSRTQSK